MPLQHVKLKSNTSEAKILLDAKVNDWDEAPMTHVHAFLAVDRLLKDLTKCDEPFGGKIILLGGDFRQILSVILRGSRSLTDSNCIKKHRLWSDFFVMKLAENICHFDSGKEFAIWHLYVGEFESGDKIQLPHFDIQKLKIPFNNSLVTQILKQVEYITNEILTREDGGHHGGEDEKNQREKEEPGVIEDVAGVVPNAIVEHAQQEADPQVSKEAELCRHLSERGNSTDNWLTNIVIEAVPIIIVMNKASGI
ncbi:hypothetical protein AVEN_97653-1 [Araneus ventricosus]|uniref:ATP-dependent DNA helicase n=1 Tax=Araneus ventricosus TaxID=182803 RepID=A0A4Y2GUU6_ARAVE|nr:hypothetical protein AVEN_97653-1 [Araneus ventricosus]